MSDYVLVLISATLVNHLCLQQQPTSQLRLHVLGLACALSIAPGLIETDWAGAILSSPERAARRLGAADVRHAGGRAATARQVAPMRVSVW